MKIVKEIVKEMDTLLDDFEDENIRIKSKRFPKDIECQEDFTIFTKFIKIENDSIKHIDFTVIAQKDSSYFNSIKIISKSFRIIAESIINLNEINLPDKLDIGKAEIISIIDDTLKRIKVC